MKILLTDTAWGAPTVEQDIYAAAGHELVVADRADEPTLRALAPGCGAITTCWAQVPATVIAAAGPALRHIARYGVGLDNIDVAAARSRGILVTNVPDYCVDEVAEHTLALILALARRVPALDRSMRDGRWSPQAGGQIRRLRGRTCGIIGLGRIGAAVAARAAAFGLKVVAYHPRLSEDEAARRGARLVALPTLLAESDIVTLHVPLTDQTRHLIDAEALARMKPDAVLINTARGALLDTEALVAALRTGRIGGAGLDVYEQEPPAADGPLFDFDNVLLTPHTAFYSEEALVELQRRVAEEVVRVAADQSPRNPVGS